MITPALLLTSVVLAQPAASGVRVAYPQSIPVPRGTPPPDYFRIEVLARDGIKLLVHEWAPAKPVPGKPVVLFLHGIGMHGEPYGAIAFGFTARGIPFVVADLRGHGRSGGLHGELAAPHILRADVGAVLGLIDRRHPGAAVVLVGDSMGGALATDYAWRGERRLAGLALLVPAFGVNPGQWGEVGRDLLPVLGGRFPLATEARLAPSTRSPGFLKARLADPLALADVPVAYLTTIGSLERELPRAAGEIKLPLFVCVAGDDRVTDLGATRRFFDRAATPRADKVWLELKGTRHTVCWDPATSGMVDELAAWVLRRAPPAKEAKGRPFR
jgi:alpha-beta hydrolase superfamily lysophospholipase